MQIIQKGTVDYDLVKSLKYRYDKKYQEALSITLPHRILIPLFSSLNKEQLDSLDNILSEKNNYFSQRLKRINILSRRISESSDATTTFNLTGEIFNELKSYNLDSAYRYVKQRLAVAVKSGDARWIQEAQMNLAEVYSITGMYNDALDILGNLNVAPDRLSYYYHIHHATYLQQKD